MHITQNKFRSQSLKFTHKTTGQQPVSKIDNNLTQTCENIIKAEQYKWTIAVLISEWVYQLLLLSSCYG